MEVEEIYKQTDKIILKNLMLYDTLMEYSQAYGYNGFKRYFRIRAKNMMCKHIELQNQLFDNFRKILKIESPVVTGTSYLNIKSILEATKNNNTEDLKNLANLSNEYFQKVGIKDKTISAMIFEEQKEWNKISRYIARCSDTSWNAIEIHSLDDRLHEKMKEEEKQWTL